MLIPDVITVNNRHLKRKSWPYLLVRTNRKARVALAQGDKIFAFNSRSPYALSAKGGRGGTNRKTRSVPEENGKSM